MCEHSEAALELCEVDGRWLTVPADLEAGLHESMIWILLLALIVATPR
jgi:hypothetical protein